MDEFTGAMTRIRAALGPDPQDMPQPPARGPAAPDRASMGREAYQRGLQARGVPSGQARAWADARMSWAAAADARPPSHEQIMRNLADARAELDALNARRQAKRDRNAASERLGWEAFERANRELAARLGEPEPITIAAAVGLWSDPVPITIW